MIARLAIISDVHGNVAALEAVLRDIAARGCDATINLGDCVTSPLWPRETFELLASANLPTVRGNHDRWLTDVRKLKEKPLVAEVAAMLSDEQRLTLGALPASLTLDGGVVAFHARRSTDTKYLLEDKSGPRLALASARSLAARLRGLRAELVLCGHSHNQHATSTPGIQLVVNPGSVGCPRTAGDDDHLDGEATSPHARYAIATRRGKRWSAELIVLDYDWRIVAKQAKRNGRADWAALFA